MSNKTKGLGKTQKSLVEIFAYTGIRPSFKTAVQRAVNRPRFKPRTSRWRAQVAEWKEFIKGPSQSDGFKPLQRSGPAVTVRNSTFSHKIYFRLSYDYHNKYKLSL